MKKRDIQLDIYRALAMIWVPCVVHVMYWLNVGSEPLLSLLIFTQPVFFFISGAAVSFSSSKKTFRTRFINRFKRIIMPFYIYTLVSLVIMTLYTLMPFHEEYFMTIHHFKFSNILEMLFLHSIPGSLMCWHIWFIIPYLLITITSEYQKTAINKIGTSTYLLILAAILFALKFVDFTYKNEVCNTICYDIFFVIGMKYYKKLNVRKIFLVMCLSLLFLVLYPLGNGHLFPMQHHKFPPDLVFVIYGLFFLSFLSVIFTYVTIKPNRLLDIWNKDGYTIYLYQNMVIGSFFLLMRGFFPNFLEENRFMYCLLAMIYIFVVSTYLSKVTVPIEKWFLKILKIDKLK